MSRLICFKCGTSIWRKKTRFAQEPKLWEILKDSRTYLGEKYKKADPLHDACVSALLRARKRAISQEDFSESAAGEDSCFRDASEEFAMENEPGFGDDQNSLGEEPANCHEDIELVDTQASTQVSSVSSTPVSSAKSSQAVATTSRASSSKSRKTSAGKSTRGNASETIRGNAAETIRGNASETIRGNASETTRAMEIEQSGRVHISAMENRFKRPRQESLKQFRNQAVQTDNTIGMSNESQISLESSDMSAQQFVETQFSSESQSISVTGEKRTRLSNRVEIGNKQKVKVDLYSISGAENVCCVCPKPKIRTRVPKSAREDMWLTRSVWMPSGTRCCSDHLEGPKEHRTLKEVSKGMVANKATLGAWLTRSDITKLIRMLTAAANRPHINMQQAEPCENDYELLFGLKKADFNDLLGKIERKLRLSIHRSPADALALLLMKLRLGVSQQVLASLFDLPQRKVSRSLWRVTEVLQEFVSQNVGYSSISREDLLAYHDSAYVRQLYKVPPGNLILFLDATYLFVQKSGDHGLQSGLYNVPKGRHLTKPMMVIAPSGRIVAATGLYFSDGRHNDAKMLRHMFEDPNGIASLLKPGDVLIVDRGFRDVKAFLESKGYVVKMPELLGKNQKQFTAEEANKSRTVCLTRWRVEALNGRLKGLFRFFDLKIPHQYYIRNCEKKLTRLLELACALINKYRPPNYTDSPRAQRILEECFKRASLENTLKPEVEPIQRKKRIWKKTNAREFEGFPRMSNEDLENITLGNYQISNAISYVDDHLRTSADYELMRHSGWANLLRVKLRSKYRRSKTHNVYVEFGQKPEEEKILRWYCTCKSGERTMGCCSHVASVIWFLGIRRHETTSPFVPRTFGTGLIEIAKIRMQTDDIVESDLEDDCDWEVEGEEAGETSVVDGAVGNAVRESPILEESCQGETESEEELEEVEAESIGVGNEGLVEMDVDVAESSSGEEESESEESEDWSDVEGWSMPIDE